MVQYCSLSLLCIVLILFLLPGCSDSEKKKQKHYSRAMEYIHQEDQKSAIIELRNAIQIDPKFAEARYQLGLLRLEEGNMRAAFGELKRTADLDPTNLDAGVKAAEFLLLAKNPDESRKYLMKVLEYDPSHSNGLALLANLELKDGNYQAALEALDKIQGSDAEIDRIYNTRGRIYAAQGKTEESEEMMLRAIELGPKNLANYQALLQFYQEQKRKEDTEQLLQEMVAAFPDNGQVQVLLANFYSATGQPEKATEAIHKAIEAEPDRESLRLLVAGLYKEQRKYQEAIDFLKKSSEELPESLQIKATLADLYFDIKRLDEARALIDSIFTSNPTHGGATFVKAKLLLQEKNTREANDLFLSLTNDYPKWPDPHYFLALSHLQLGEMELAQKAAGVALQLKPADSRFHTLQSQLYLMQRDGENASREAKTALRLNPRNFPAAKLLVKALLLDKRYDEAIEIINNIREKVPNDLDMLESLGLAYMGKKENQQARDAFTQLLELAPDNSKALTLLATMSANDDLSNARKIVEQYIELAPEAAGHYMLLGNLLLKDKQPEKALEAFSKAQTLAPQSPQPYIIRARLMHSLGKTDEAIAEFQELLEQRPDSVPANLGLASLYEFQHKQTEAKALYEKVLELQPDHPAAANNLAYLTAQEKDGDLGEALRLAMLAKQAEPDDPRIADTLGMVHYKRNSFILAISQFQQALTAMPEDPVLNYHLAMAQFANDDLENALGSVKKALETKVEFSEREEAEQLLQKMAEAGPRKSD